MKIQNQRIELPILKEKGISLFIKRDDLNHPIISGNKLRKLKYNLIEAKKQHFDTLLTFGGAYSNHIVATAAAGKEQGFRTIGVIRGDELGKDLKHTLTNNPSLKQAYELGMQFKFVTRTAYRMKTTKPFIDALINEFGAFYLIPEGGTNSFAVKGCEEILTDDDSAFDFITTAIGTGGTISGVINASSEEQQVLGFPALKGDFLEDEIKKYTNKNNWNLIKSYHFGGFAKVNDDLILFLNDFYNTTSVPLDPIYTGKMLFGLIDLIKNDYFARNSSILAIHTGGIQGVRGMNVKLLDKKKNLIAY